MNLVVDGITATQLYIADSPTVSFVNVTWQGINVGGNNLVYTTQVDTIHTSGCHVIDCKVGDIFVTIDCSYFQGDDWTLQSSQIDGLIQTTSAVTITGMNVTVSTKKSARRCPMIAILL